MRPSNYLGNGRSLVRLSTGEPLVVDTFNLDLAYSLITTGEWEDWILQRLLPLIHNKAVIVDAGANIGFYSVVLGKRAPEGRVYAFEPNPRLFDILQSNMLINGLSRDHCFAVALGADEREVQLRHRIGESGGGHVVAADAKLQSNQVGFTARQARLDTIISVDEFIDVLKIDVEGYEPEVLAGARRLLGDRKVGHVVMEMSPSAWRGRGQDPVAFLATFEANGYSLEVLKPDGGVLVDAGTAVSAVEALPYVTCILASRHD